MQRESRARIVVADATAHPAIPLDDRYVRDLEATARHREAVLGAVCYAASRFLGTADWDRDIQEVLARLGRAADVSRVYLFESFSDERGTIRARMRHEWVSPGVTPRIGVPEVQNLPLAEVGLARWESLREGIPICGSGATLLPSERAYFAPRGIRSLAVMPVFAGPTWWGFLGFTDDVRDRDWSPELLEVLQAAAGALGAVLYRNRTEEELRDSEERFRGLVEAAAEGILIHDQGIVLDANPAFARMFGYGPDELVGRNFLDVLPTPESRGAIERHVHSGSEERYEAACARRDGSSIIAEITARTMSYYGRTVRVEAIHDVTERTRAEENARRLIREQAARAEAERAEWRATFLSEASRVLSTSLDYHTTMARLARLTVPALADYCVVDVVDSKGNVELVGSAHRDSAEEQLLQEAERYLSGRTRQVHHLSKALVDGESVLVPEITEAMLDAAYLDAAHRRILRRLRPTSLVAVPLRAPDRIAGVLALYTTEPDRRYGPDDLALAEELAHRASLAVENARLLHRAHQATQARDEILGIVAHDLRNPLATIAMAAGMLLDRTSRNGGSTRRKLLEMIRRAADRMDGLIQDLLEVARIENGRLTVDARPVSASALVAEAVEMLRPLAASSSVALMRDVPADAPPVMADPARIQQVLSNLIGNAVKFTPAGGRITVKAEPAGDEVRFAVADTGPGIPPDRLPHIFSRFWQGTRTDRRGIGLGLLIAKGIVDAHGGRIWVESRPGEGSTFLYTLPVARA